MVRENSGVSSSNGSPAWLASLVATETDFFGGCGAHSHRRKSEKNVFCFHCCRSICPHCLPSHSSHPLLQVRRYVYHDVVRLADLEKLIDCSYIQPYTINGAKVLFLRKRVQNKAASSPNSCFTCQRILQHPFRFCSISCKVELLVRQGQDVSGIMYQFDASEFSIAQFEGLRMDADAPPDREPPMAGGGDGRILMGSRRKGAPHRAPLS